MKKVLLFVLFLLLPIVVHAESKRYTYNQLRNSDTVPLYLEEGDVIYIDNGFDNLYIYIDDNQVANLYGYYVASGNPTVEEYVIPEKLIFGSLNWDSNNDYLYLYSVDENTNYINYSPDKKEIYKPGDVIIIQWDSIPSTQRELNYYIYDYDDELIMDGMLLSTYVAYKFPDLGKENTLWTMDIFDDGAYSEAMPHFYPLDYVGPNFSLNCDDDRIEYGKKTNCSVFVKSTYPLKYVSFNLSNPNFRITNAKLTDEMSSMEGEYEFNMTFPNEYNYFNNYTIMTFEVEATKPENYTDSVQILDIHYVDEYVEDEYESLDGAISVIYKMINPETFNNLFFIMIPLFLSGAAFLFYQKHQQYEKEQ